MARRDWSDARVVERGGIRQEVRYVASRGVDVLACSWTAAPRRRPHTLLSCGPWGFESVVFRDVPEGLASGAASDGGAGVGFDYPGHGDSLGAVEQATLDALVAAAIDVARACGGPPWAVAGFRLGASVAALVAGELDADAVLLVEPELDPERHLAQVARRSRRANLGDPEAEGLVFGVPLGPAVLDSVAGTGAQVDAALAHVRCPVATVRFSDTVAAGDGGKADARGEDIVIEGALTYEGRRHPQLVDAGCAWLARALPQP